MTTYILYHDNCPDGFAAALACKRANLPNPVFIPCRYGMRLQDVLAEIQLGDKTVVVDFSFPRDQMQAFHDAGYSLLVLDHHKTAEADCAGLPFCVFDMNRSGAVMAWEYFHSGEVPELIRYVQDRDLWRWEMPHSREFSAALGSYQFDFAVWEQLIEMPSSILIEEGRVCLRLKNQQVEIMAGRSRLVEFDVSTSPPQIRTRPTGDGYVVPTVNATVFFSEVGERMCQQDSAAPFSAYWFVREDGKTQWGLRSRSDFDCSAVAKAFGGGGHKGAAGFTTANPPTL